mmetsp:Transcript_20638/g.47677  ORF Transcript_20638/g.47677 Transcript_20638/m.47677 type:complete len:203 (-) Transcript_20638:336-944(-)|eukprot:CAMPEP_0116845292 /NCGR_PEP_ID=MMETSP0418-20121206/13180_1 /TAXON_ID=1158023 /ORGANISM="Astrosyne radiata, Strain 13vi08-1A" /LENGTH=202 /DNA_ID=CAMNT_0004476375 /DNA_START=40 /DNA_END=648 /DNA_ORIENTATION=+
MSPLRNDLIHPFPNDDLIPAKQPVTTKVLMTGTITTRTTPSDNMKTKKRVRFQDENNLVQDDVLHRISHLTRREIRACFYTFEQLDYFVEQAEILAFFKGPDKVPKRESLRGLEKLVGEGYQESRKRIKNVVTSVLAAQAQHIGQDEIAHVSMTHTSECLQEALERAEQDHRDAQLEMVVTKQTLGKKLFARGWGKARGFRK